MSKKTKWIIAIVVVIVLAIVGYFIWKSQQTPAAAAVAAGTGKVPVIDPAISPISQEIPNN